MATRLESLRRMAAVQKQMVRLSECRLAGAERACRDLSDDQTRLQGYVNEEGALGVSLAKSALRSLHRLDRRIGVAERERDTTRAALDASKRREQAVADLTMRVQKVFERQETDRDLAATIESWLAIKGASLP